MLGVSGVSLATDEELALWVERFRVYRKPPGKADILAWLALFSPEHVPAAKKILNAVKVVSEVDIHRCYKASLEGLPGWSRDANAREGRWYFVGVGSAGESGPAMLRMFREANGLTSDKWQSYFVTMRELPSLRLSAFDKVVFVDDFAGSGKQITDYWPTMQELVASEAKCYLLLTATTQAAATLIGQETELNLISCIVMGDADNIFSEQCMLLSTEEKTAIHEYGKVAWDAWPRGFREGGLLLVLSHKTPNNTVPVLHANKPAWPGLFPRTLIAAG